MTFGVQSETSEQNSEEMQLIWMYTGKFYRLLRGVYSVNTQP